MFPQSTCRTRGCGRLAFYGKEHCLHHLKDPAAAGQEATELLQNSARIVNTNLSLLQLQQLDLSGKRLTCCCFSYSSFTAVNFDNLKAETVFFDFCILKNCSFRSSDLKFVVFAGASIEDCDFSHSNILNCNFIGADCHDSEFAESDLYASRFIATDLNRVGMADCNLKRASFSHARLQDINFRYSNVEDASFEAVIREI